MFQKIEKRIKKCQRRLTNPVWVARVGEKRHKEEEERYRKLLLLGGVIHILQTLEV